LFHCCLCLSFWTTLSNHQSLLQKAYLLWPKIHYKNHYASVQLRSALQHTNIATLIATHICEQVRASACKWVCISLFQVSKLIMSTELPNKWKKLKFHWIC
jgi:hypothetical protein